MQHDKIAGAIATQASKQGIAPKEFATPNPS
jgi:hypothetical protein